MKNKNERCWCNASDYDQIGILDKILAKLGHTTFFIILTLLLSCYTSIPKQIRSLFPPLSPNHSITHYKGKYVEIKTKLV